MEEAQLEEAGMHVSTELDEWEITARERVDMAVKQNAIETRVRWSEWVISALEGGARKAHALSKAPVTEPVQRIHSVQDAPLVANTPVLAAEKRNFRSCGYRGNRRLLRGLHRRTGACLEERAPVDLFLHRCGNALAPVDALEQDLSCARRKRATKKGPVSCHCVVCLETASPSRTNKPQISP